MSNVDEQLKTVQDGSYTNQKDDTR